jgi:hypothetical protein
MYSADLISWLTIFWNLFRLSRRHAKWLVQYSVDLSFDPYGKSKLTFQHWIQISLGEKIANIHYQFVRFSIFSATCATISLLMAKELSFFSCRL